MHVADCIQTQGKKLVNHIGIVGFLIQKKPYSSLKEAFNNWRIVEENVNYQTDPTTGDFTVSGKYNNKWGQQDFLIEMLSPVLSNTYIDITGENFEHYIWIVDNHVYRTSKIDGVDVNYNSSDDDSDDDDSCDDDDPCDDNK